MFRRLKDEDGFALITAIGVSFVVLFLAVAATSLSLHNNDQSANERRRVNAIDAAESGIYYYLSYLQSTGGVQPVCQITQTLAGTPIEKFVVTPTFYNGSGTPYSCPVGSSLATGIVPASVLVHSTGSVSNLAYPVRAMEAYAILTVNQGSTFGSSSALFAQTSVTFQANAQVGGGQYSDADLYSNGSVSVAANSTLYGNVYAQGAVTLQANSEVKKSVWANGSITLGGNARIRGNATAAPSTATISMTTQSTIYGNATAGSTITGGTVVGFRTPNTPSAAPPAKSYPTFTYTSTDWSGATPAYAVTPTYTTANCTQPVTDLGNWWGAAAGSYHVLRITGTACTLSLATASIKGNLAIIADGNVALANGAKLTASGGPWNLYIFAGLAGAGGCNYGDGVNSSIGPGLNTLIYTPQACSVTLNNNSSITQGQIISGSITFKKSMAMQFQQVQVPGSGSGGFKEDVTYIREVRAP